MSIYYVCLLRWSELRAYASSQGIPWPLENELTDSYNSFAFAYNETTIRYGKHPIFFEGGENTGLDWLFNQLFPPHAYCPAGKVPTVVMPVGVTVSSAYTGPTLDGYWNAASYPVQWIEFALPAGSTIGGISARVNQAPNGPTTHSIEFDGQPLGIWDGSTVSNQILQWGPSAGISVARIRIITTKSPSWVAWSGITFAECS